MSPSRCQKRGCRSIMQGSIFLIVPPPLLFLLSSWLYFCMKKEKGQMRCSKSKTSSKSILSLRPDSRLAFHLHSVLDFSRWLHRIMDDREGGREGGRLQAGRSPSMMGHLGPALLSSTRFLCAGRHHRPFRVYFFVRSRGNRGMLCGNEIPRQIGTWKSSRLM